MSILPDLSYARTRSTYVPTDVGFIDNVGANLEAEYHKNKETADLYLDKLNQLRVRDVNTPILEDVRNKVKSNLDAIAQQGDYENADLQLKKLAYETANNPLLKGALDDYASYSKHQEQLASLKDVPEDRKNLALGYSNATNNKMLEYDPVTGYKNMYQGYTPGKIPDLNKIVGEFSERIKASKEPIIIGKDKDGNPIYMGRANNGYYIVGDREGIGEQEAQSIIRAHVNSHPEIQSYLKENLLFDKFQKKYNPVTGQYDPFSLQDFGINDLHGEGEFFYTLAKEGHNPADFTDPKRLESLYDQIYLDRAVSEISDPYAAAVSHTKTNFDYKTNQEWLNNQQGQISLRNSLAKMKAEEAKDKRLIDYKADKEAEKEARQQYALSNPVEAESVNLEISEKQLANVESDLKVLQAKKEAAMKGTTGPDGSAITFSPQEQQKLVSLQNDKRLLEHESSVFLNTALTTSSGNEIIERNYNNFVKFSGNKENISYEEFQRRLKDNDIQEPKRQFVQGNPYGNPFINSDADVNTYLKRSKEELGKDKTVNEAVNNIMTLEANGLFAFDDGSSSEKSSALNKVKTTLVKNVLSQGGVGYDVVGAGKRLNEILQGDLVQDGDEKKYKGKKVDVSVIPLNRTQKGVTDEDVMYQIVIKDAKDGTTLRSMRIRPQDQQSHADLMYNLNVDLAKNYDESSIIGRDARINIMTHELPQFRIGENRRLLDSQVNDKSPRGSIGVGELIQLGNESWTFVKTKTPVVDHFDGDNPNAPVTVLQETYHLVRLKDNLPGNVKIDPNNIYKYVYDFNGSKGMKGIYDSAVPNERNISTPNLKQYGARNKDAATAFSSLEDALSVFYNSRGK